MENSSSWEAKGAAAGFVCIVLMVDWPYKIHMGWVYAFYLLRPKKLSLSEQRKSQKALFSTGG